MEATDPDLRTPATEDELVQWAQRLHDSAAGRKDNSEFDEAVSKGFDHFIGKVHAGELLLSEITWRRFRRKVHNLHRNLRRSRIRRQAAGLDFESLRVPRSTEVEYLVRVPGIITSVALRTLSACVGRLNKPSLDSIDAQVHRIYLDLDLDIHTLTAEDLALVRDLSLSPARWRGQLAEHYGRQPSYITARTQEADRLIRLGIYLFILLAPNQHAVVSRAVMGTLLDLVHRAGPELSTDERRLLQRVADWLQFDEGNFPINQAGLYRDVQSLQSFRGSSVDEVIETLHVGEGDYAVHVPGQSSTTPHFRCVRRCPDHTSRQEGDLP